VFWLFRFYAFVCWPLFNLLNSIEQIEEETSSMTEENAESLMESSASI